MHRTRQLGTRACLLAVVTLVTALASWPAAASSDDPLAPPDADVFGQFASMIRWSGVLTSIVVIIGAVLGIRFVRDLVERLSRQFANRRLLLNKFATILQFVVYVGTAATVLLLSFRLDAGVLAIIGGTVAVSVGFAVKDLVASFIAGIMIMIDRPFQVGDRITFGGQYGDITAIPNNMFINDITSNGNYGALDTKYEKAFETDVNLRELGAFR